MYTEGEVLLQDEGGLRQMWKAVAAIFLIILLVAAGVTIERAAGRRRRAPSGFGELQKSTYAITEKSGQYNRPRALVDTSGWKTVDLEKFGVEMAVPAEWEQRGGGFRSSSVAFVISSSLYGSKEFVISLLNNPRDYNGQEFIWREVLGYKTAMAEGINSGVIDLPSPWLIDGVEGTSVYCNEPGERGEYIVLPRRLRMLVFYIEDLRFSPANSELFTVLSTVKLTD